MSLSETQKLVSDVVDVLKERLVETTGASNLDGVGKIAILSQ